MTRLGPRGLAEHRDNGNALAERYLSAILQNAPDALVATTRDCAIVGWNDAATRLFGATWDEVSEKNFPDLIAPEDRRAASALLSQAAAGRACHHRNCGFRAETVPSVRWRCRPVRSAAAAP
ncbi:PAS domain-containing protein [Pseudoroseomonas wenyumeiae]